MPEFLESAFVYLMSGSVILVLAVKEFAAYRLPATHRLNEILNPPKDTWSRGASRSDWEAQNNVNE